PSGASGGAAWVLWAGGIGLTSARLANGSPTLGLAATACRLGTLFASVGQQIANRKARRRSGLASRPDRGRGYRVGLSPWQAGPTQGVRLVLVER
ncbi:MAG: hypothetical protein AAF602_29270, partial [Myxococcota bacterium]